MPSILIITFKSHQKFNIVEFVAVNLIVLDYLLLEITTHWLFTSDVVMEARASSGLSFIGM